MCHLMSSLLFYNVENSKNKEKPLNEYVSKLLTGTSMMGSDLVQSGPSVDVNIKARVD